MARLTAISNGKLFDVSTNRRRYIVPHGVRENSTRTHSRVPSFVGNSPIVDSTNAAFFTLSMDSAICVLCVAAPQSVVVAAWPPKRSKANSAWLMSSSASVPPAYRNMFRVSERRRMPGTDFRPFGRPQIRRRTNGAWIRSRTPHALEGYEQIHALESHRGFDPAPLSSRDC